MVKRLLIIPARKNSKRILNKNIKLFYGKPIISYSIKTALKSKIFDKIHISTDNKNLKKIINKYGLEIDFYRPKNLSDDKTGLIDVYSFVIEKYHKLNLSFDEVWFLSACSPLIKSQDLIKASKYFKKSNANTLLSISKYSPHIQRAFYYNKEKLYPVNKNFIKKNSQNIPETYYHTGNFGAFKYAVFKRKNKKFNYTGYELPRERSVDIDQMEDWNLAVKLFNNLR